MILLLLVVVAGVAATAYLYALGDRLHRQLRHATVPTPATTRAPRSLP